MIWKTIRDSTQKDLPRNVIAVRMRLLQFIDLAQSPSELQLGVKPISLWGLFHP